MKKRTKLLLGLTLVAGMASLASCSKGENDGGDTRVADAVADAMTLTRDELFKKAAEELGTKGKIEFIATTSRGGKTAAKTKFIQELQKHNSNITDPLKYSSTVDGRIYTMIQAEIDSGNNAYDGAILQDGYQLQTKAINKGNIVNYIPKEWSDNNETDTSKDGNPFALQYNFKTWMVNNKNNDTVIDNVWDVTASKYKGKLQTMDPTNENVNMDWLCMLTSDAENAKLKTAFEASTNDNKDLDLTPYETYGDKKYAYAFIAKFIENAVFNADDGKAIDALVAAPGNIGWIVYSKLENVTETAAISKKNIVIAALGSDNTDGSKKGDSSMTGFGGFMYKHYPAVIKTCEYPYATCAFINILSTTEEGYSVWANDVGDYPTMPSIGVDRSTKGNNIKGVGSDNKETTISCPALNDPSSSWWTGKGGAIVETPSVISAQYPTVINFIFTQIANKK